MRIGTGAAGAAPVREDYLGRHENARYWVDFDDFAFYRMEVRELYFVAGFGAMGWVEAGALLVGDSMRGSLRPWAMPTDFSKSHRMSRLPKAQLVIGRNKAA